MRVTYSVVRKARKKSVLKLAEGFRGRRKNCYGLAIDAVIRSHVNQYKGRIARKRDMRSLFIVRINAAVRPYGLNYSTFMNKYMKLVQAGALPALNRKSLSEIAVYYGDNENGTNYFATLVQKVLES